MRQQRLPAWSRNKDKDLVCKRRNDRCKRNGRFEFCKSKAAESRPSKRD